MTNDKEDEVSKQHIILGDGWNFYVLRQQSTSCNLMLDHFNHNMKFIKKIKLMESSGKFL